MDNKKINEGNEYNNISVWEDNDMIDNLGEELKPDSTFIYISECMPFPCCASYGCVNWFNNVYALAGYVKFMVLNVTFSTILDCQQLVNENLEALINDALSRGNITADNAKHMIEAYKAIDKCFGTSKEEAMASIVKTVDYYNEHFEKIRGFDFRLKLFNGIDELRPFVINYFNRDIVYTKNKVEQLFSDCTAHEFEEMLNEIIS